MNRYRLFVIITLAAVALQACDFEDRYVHLCEGKYGSDKVIDSLSKRYHLTNHVYFAQSRKDYLAPEHPNCDTISLEIQPDSIPFFYNDTFAVSVAKIFFHDSLNHDVSYLKIHLIDYTPEVKPEINFIVGRKDLYRDHTPGTLIDTADMQYEITKANTYTASTGKETWEGMYVDVDVKEDYKDITKLGSLIKTRYDSTIKANKLSEFQVRMTIRSPSCKLCTDKKYELFYTRENKDL